MGRILEWVAISFSRGSSWPRNRTWVSCTAGRFFTNWAKREASTELPQWYSVQFSRSVMSSSLRPHESQHTRPPSPSPTPGVYPNSCPLSQWCHPTISSSVVIFSSCLQSFPVSESFQMSQFFALGSQRIGVSASASVLPMNIQGWFPLRCAGWIPYFRKKATLQ